MQLPARHVLAAQPGAGLEQDPEVAGDGRFEHDRATVQRGAEGADLADPASDVVVEAGQPDRHRAVRPDPDGGAVRVAAGHVPEVHRHLGAATAAGLVRQLEGEPQPLVGGPHRVQRCGGGTATRQRADQPAAVSDREVGAPVRGIKGPGATTLGPTEAVLHGALERVMHVENRCRGPGRPGLQGDQEADGGQEHGAEHGDALTQGETGCGFGGCR
jgi:hypothetical protein